MKKSYLAAAAILGAAVFAGEAHAVKINLGKGKSFKMGFRAKIHATYVGDRGANSRVNPDDATDRSDLVIAVPFSRIYAKGSISKVLKWAWQADLRPGSFQMVDTFIMLDFAKEFKIYAGQIKLPFELHSGIQSGWSVIMPTGPVHQHAVREGTDRDQRGLRNNPFTNPANRDERAPGSGSRSPQIGIWGKIGGGMIKYYLYIMDGINRDSVIDRDSGYGVRVEFAPTMAGYKGHPGFVLKETYLGKQNTLSIGISYFSQNYGAGAATQTSFGVDALWEHKLGTVTPNINIGYVQHRNWRGANGDNLTGIIVQGQLLINKKTLFGKPAIAARWAQSDRQGFSRSDVIGVVGQFYVKGVGNRIALSVDRVRDPNQANPDKDSWTDVTLAFWYNF